MGRYERGRVNNGRQVKLRVAGVLAAYTAGVALILVALILLRSMIVMLAGVALIVLVRRWAQRFLHCPSCGASIYPFVFIEPAIWNSGIPGECPHCGVSFH